jgi:maltose phosphorylase
MPRCNFGGQRIVWKIISGKANAAICAGLDFSRLHQMSRTNYWNTENAYAEGNCVSIKGMTKTSGQTLYASAVFSAYGKGNADDAKKPFIEYEFEGGGSLERVFMVSKTDEAIPRDVAYDMLKEESAQWWRRQWETSDIVIEGDDAQQQGIRFGIFQMHQTMHTGGHSAVFGAKGLTGEAYNGNTFWDTEVYCLPFYLYNNPEAAKTIMRFRYDTLGRAKERAAMLDCQGAFYPIATISGRECCDMWQHASLQLQASTAVAYAIQKYTQITGDDSFLKECGMEILVEVCRMLASRGAFDPVTGEYGFYGVMGPDEFQVMVNHNAYTNFVAKKTLEYTVDTLRQTKTNPIFAPTDEEIADWTNKASRMKILYDDETKLFEQHEGYYHLPHVDVASIPVTDFPLYSHWSYDRIYRNDMLKQPDVLMFMLMYAEEFTSEQFKANYDFYEPRCIHESSLSPSVHSIIAAKLGLTDEAYRFFEFGSRMDLDNYNRNTREGLHSTSIAGSWMNIVYGFGGLTVRDGVPAFTTSLPSAWKSLSFNVLFRGRLINVNIAHGESRLKLCRGEPIAVELNGKMVSLS